MKKVLGSGIGMVMAFFIANLISIHTARAQESVSLQVFYDELQPYGTWMDYGDYGYVWIPRVERDFTPYATNGYWINTEYGNTWVSDYTWGWAPFHYGRWFRDDFYGWIWVPDTEWAPAWVAWRSGGGYYGWAPLMPGIAIHTSFHHYHRIPHYYWSFVPYRYITYRHVYTHCVPRPRVINIINHTTIITHNYTDNRRRTYFTGPTRHEIERRNHERVVVHKINNSGRPGRTEVTRGTANIYRPEIDNSRESRTRSTPSSFVKRDRMGNQLQMETNRREKISEGSTFKRENAGTNNPQRTYRNRTTEQKPNVLNRDVQRSEYSPAKRSSQFETRSRSNDEVKRDQQAPVRNRQEYGKRESSGPVNRDVQRRSTEQFQRSATKPSHREQFERPNTNRQHENVQRQRSYENPQPSRSSGGQSHQELQFRKSGSDQSSRQPSRNVGESRKNPVRSRN
ncbi:MAG TPA: DUF6600 domain-containing protein [Chryseolinea sp.]|nr:DUF6600 domain-containing protein [Chryseolinea sp.]